MKIAVKGKDCLFGKCHGSSKERERRISAVDLTLIGLEGWVEAGLVEMGEGKRGEVLGVSFGVGEIVFTWSPVCMLIVSMCVRDLG